ncbi:MAG TPA: hypothetical protein VF139_00285 [Candidatus Polarisedimenticolaceae bacterium]
MADAALSRYWTLLGLEPGTSLEQLETHYYLLVEKAPKNPTEEDQKRLHEMHHAYGVLRRALAARASAGALARVNAFVRRRIAVVATLAVGGCIALVALNWNSIQVATRQYDSGDVVRIRGSAESFGTIESFSEQHRFENGKSAPAYRIRRATTNETVYVQERTVELAMTR